MLEAVCKCTFRSRQLVLKVLYLSSYDLVVGGGLLHARHQLLQVGGLAHPLLQGLGQVGYPVPQTGPWAY